jgi:hypothetical protein
MKQYFHIDEYLIENDPIYLPNLRVLIFNFSISPHLESNLLRILSLLVAPCLEEIYIKCDYHWSPPDRLEWCQWSKIDRILDGKEFASLQRVKILVPYESSEDTILQTVFPSLVSRGLLKVKYENTDWF